MPVPVSIISQVTPSEVSLIKRVAYEPAFLHHLRHHLNISGVSRVFMHEPLTNLRKLIVIQMKSDTLDAEVCARFMAPRPIRRRSAR